jgi:hypothetical protein
MIDDKPAPVHSMNCPTCTACIMTPTAELLPKAYADHVEAMERISQPGEPHYVKPHAVKNAKQAVKLVMAKGAAFGGRKRGAR